MRTIKQIKDECIEIDLSNVLLGDKSIGTFIDGDFMPFRDSQDVELFYSQISIKELLKIYSSYNGLSDYKIDEPTDYLASYNIDILSIIEFL
jgi:hypothetical protein